MSERAPLRVAVIGLGVGEQHARAWAREPGFALSSLVDLDGEKARRLAAEFPGCQVVPSWERLLAEDGVDVVSIASYDDAHHQQVVQALEAGKHVFVEKPLCRTVSEVARISAALAGTGGRGKLSSNLVLRGAPGYVALRDAVAAGRFGRLYSVDGEYLYGRLDKITKGWRKDVENYSVILGGGLHMVDLLLWITGERPATVTAAGNRISTAGSDFRYDDFVAATLRFPSGLVSRIVANFGCVQPHQHVFRVYGTEATFLYDDAGPRTHLSRDPAGSAGTWHPAMLPSSKGVLIPEFARAVREDADLTEHARQLFDDITVCAAIDAALASGREERIQYI